MNADSAIALKQAGTHDNCAVTGCLKKLFSRRSGSSSGYGFVVCNRISEVAPNVEHLNADGTLEMSQAYLAAMEQSVPGAAFKYVTIFKEDKPVLFGYFQLFTLTSDNFSFEKNKGFVRCICSFFLDLKKVKVLISGNALRNETASFCFDSTVLNNEEAVQIMASVGDSIADGEGASAILLKDIHVLARTRSWLARAGYHMPMEDQNMVLDVRSSWTDIDAYIADLTRKYKARANKVLAAQTQLTVRQFSEKEVLSHERKLHQLYKNVIANQQFALTSVAGDHFAKLKKLYGDAFEVFGVFSGQKLIAFYSAIVSGDAYEIYYVGIDYQYNTEYQLYFNILFAGLDRAIALRKLKLKLGRTSFDAKAGLGAKPVQTGYFIKTAGIPAAVVRWFVNYFSSIEDAKWKLRNPLK